MTVSPLVGRTQLDAISAYGFPKESLNLSCYMALNGVPEGTEFEGVRVASLNDGGLQRFNMLHHIVLPVQGAETIIAHMLKNGVEPERITCLEQDMTAALQLQQPKTAAAAE